MHAVRHMRGEKLVGQLCCDTSSARDCLVLDITMPSLYTFDAQRCLCLWRSLQAVHVGAFRFFWHREAMSIHLWCSVMSAQLIVFITWTKSPAPAPAFIGVNVCAGTQCFDACSRLPNSTLFSKLNVPWRCGIRAHCVWSDVSLLGEHWGIASWADQALHEKGN